MSCLVGFIQTVDCMLCKLVAIHLCCASSSYLESKWAISHCAFIKIVLYSYAFTELI